MGSNLSVVEKSEIFASKENEKTIVAEKKLQLKDMETGEKLVVDHIQKFSYGVKNFWKCYLMDFLSILGILDNKQVDVFIYVAENTNPSNNIFLATYKKISRDVDVCEATIAKIMKKLQEHNFIKKIQNGAWFVNPNILMKGNDRKRQILLSYYRNDEPIDEITSSKINKKLP